VEAREPLARVEDGLLADEQPRHALEVWLLGCEEAGTLSLRPRGGDEARRRSPARVLPRAFD